ncbi:MAG TPA: hypothetical protein VFZ76_14975 [Anaerolineales bacterium]
MTDEPNSFRSLVINFAIELVVYGVLVVGYFYVVLRFLETFLTGLFRNNTTLYAFLGLGLVVGQGVLLEAVTSYILDWLNLERLE